MNVTVVFDHITGEVRTFSASEDSTVDGAGVWTGVSGEHGFDGTGLPSAAASARPHPLVPFYTGALLGLILGLLVGALWL